MADYIKRSDVLGIVFRRLKPCNALIGDLCNACEDVYRMVEQIPSADVQPVVHGEWIPEIEQMETEYPDSTEVYLETFQTGWKCSECDDYSTIDSNFCPNCGADMRGGT